MPVPSGPGGIVAGVNALARSDVDPAAAPTGLRLATALPLHLSQAPSLCPECDEVWRWCGEGGDEPELELCPGCEER